MPSNDQPTQLSELRAIMGSLKDSMPLPIAFDLDDKLVALDEVIQAVDNALTVKAGVAQSAEQVPRKDEAVGSTPISSSTAFSEEQRKHVAAIVHHRVGLEDNLKAARAADKDFKDAEDTYKKAKADAEHRRNMAVRQAKYHREQMELAEGQLREAILCDVMIKGTPEPEPEPIEEHEELGRAE